MINRGKKGQERNKQIDKHPLLNTNRHNKNNWTNYFAEGQTAGMNSDQKWTHKKIDEQAIKQTNKQTSEQKHKQERVALQDRKETIFLQVLIASFR